MKYTKSSYHSRIITLCGQIITQMIKKLKTKPEIMKQYDQVIKEQLEGGVAEEVQQDQVLEPRNVHSYTGEL